MMTDEEYETTVQQCLLLSSLARTLDAKGVLERIGRADSVAAILDPTLYRKAMPKLELVRKIVRGVVALQKELPTLEECEEAERHQAACERMEGSFR